MQRGHIREIEAVVDNPEAEPVMPCEAAKTAIIVYGKRVGTKRTVCTDKNCPVHDPKAAAEHAAHPAPVLAPAPPTETEAEREQREAEYEQRRKEHEEDQQRREVERKERFEQEQKEYEAERTGESSGESTSGHLRAHRGECPGDVYRRSTESVFTRSHQP